MQTLLKREPHSSEFLMVFFFFFRSVASLASFDQCNFFVLERKRLRPGSPKGRSCSGLVAGWTPRRPWGPLPPTRASLATSALRESVYGLAVTLLLCAVFGPAAREFSALPSFVCVLLAEGVRSAPCSLVILLSGPSISVHAFSLSGTFGDPRVFKIN